MLDEIALLSPSSCAVASKLSKIAFLSLCVRYHRGQVDEVVAQWQTKISSMKPHAGRTKSWRVEGDTSSPNMAARNAAPRATQQTPQAPSSERPRISARIRPTEAEKEQRRQEAQAKKQQEQERLSKEKQEREKQEKEEEEKLEREKKQKKEQQERERAAQNERLRKAAERRREEEERLKRAEAASEKKAIWKAGTPLEACILFSVHSELLLISAFTATKSIPASSIRSAIPWPVKSGLYKEVKYSAVKEFFLKGCPDMENPTLMFKLMQKESLKWHPDKMCALFRRPTVADAEKMVVDVIAKVVIELRGEAQEKRKC
jgi:outer membrane biosynthesis protein TonB